MDGDLPMQALEGGRVVIIGNSGSGKTWLAEQLGHTLGLPAIYLDAFRWTGDGYGQKRDEREARRLLVEATAVDAWVVEGVFTGLIGTVIDRASALIWLDLPWTECLSGLRSRGLRRGGTEEEFADLITWAEDYWGRKTATSYEGHLIVFEVFPHDKVRLRSRAAVDSFIRVVEKA